jgi:hypothetical protein
MLTASKWQVRFLSGVVLLLVVDRLWPYFTSPAGLTVIALGFVAGLVVYMNTSDALGFVQNRWLHIQTRPSRKS